MVLGIRLALRVGVGLVIQFGIRQIFGIKLGIRRGVRLGIRLGAELQFLVIRPPAILFFEGWQL